MLRKHMAGHQDSGEADVWHRGDLAERACQLGMLQAGWQGVLPHHAQLLAVLLQVPCIWATPPLQAQP